MDEFAKSTTNITTKKTFLDLTDAFKELFDGSLS